MRLLHLRLKGYLGITNGMLRDEINIDFTRSRHRIILIKGATGSGKTTILDAISPLPDDNSKLIPGMPAEKEMIFSNGMRILIQHPINSNGDRATNKAFIWENDVNLNPNGNITSFKEIVADRLGLDANYDALSKLSTRDRGLADKPPAIRKKYVSSIVDGIEVYNNMHKTLSKNSNVLKSMIRSMAAKIDSIGDEKSLDMNIAALTNLVAEYKDKQEKLLFDQAAAMTTKNAIDPDGHMQIESTMHIDRMSFAQNTIKVCDAKIDRASERLNVKFATKDTVSSFINEYNKHLINARSSAENIRNIISNLITRAESERDELQNKLDKLNMLVSSNDYDTLISSINRMTNEIKEIEEFFATFHITNTSYTTAEYDVALSILDTIEEKISHIYDVGRDVLISINPTCELTDGLIEDSAIRVIEQELADIGRDIKDCERQIIKAEGQKDTYSILNQRPSDCSIDSCPFITKALEIGEDPNIKIARLDKQRVELTKAYLDKQEALNVMLSCNEVIHLLMDLCSFVDSKKSILKCIPMLNDVLMDTKMLVREIVNKNSAMAVLPVDRDALEDLGKKTYMFDSYRALVSERDKLITQKSIFDSKAEVINEINSDVEKIRSKLRGIENSIEENQSVLRSISADIEDTTKRIEIATEIENAFIDKEAAMKVIEDCTSGMSKIAHELKELEKAEEIIQSTTAGLAEIKAALAPAEDELSKLKFSKQKLVEYNDEMSFYKANYDKTETVKAYTSPTDKGIQLIFMDMYMHNILAMANDLLARLFGGQFMLQPFIINGDEFRIPCVGNRMMNDDISSMSTGQICMISMILSFSILYNSASNYNILRLDEIDGGLDTENRTQFIQTLNEVMDILGCEQCFLISHNEEIQYSSTDMILLRTNSDNRDYGAANIIFDIDRD